MIYAIILLIFAILTITIFSLRYRAEDHSQYDQPIAPLMKSEADVSTEHQNVVKLLGQYHQKNSLNVKQSRLNMENFFEREISAKIQSVEIDGLKAEWILAVGANPARRLLYIHGGAFRIGSAKSHRYLTSEISRIAGVAVLAIDYRMQPEYKTIHCHEDVRKAYRWILENGPKEASKSEQLFVAGDSAGGNLTLAVIAWARDNNLTAANGAIAMAPLTDSTMGGTSWRKNKNSDYFLGPSLGKLLWVPKWLLALGMRITTGKPVNDPSISPLLGDLSNLPKTLIQVSKDEMLFDDSQRYANKFIAAGGDMTLQVWPRMVHIFQAFGPELPESREALDHISEFIKNA